MTRFAFSHKGDNIPSPCCAVRHDLRCRSLALRSDRATRDRNMQGDSEHAARRKQRTGGLARILIVEIFKYKRPWRIRAKVAGLQQAGSQSVTLIPLSEALDKMLLYIEDQKREKEPQDLERFKTAVVQAAVNSAFLAPGQLEEPGHTVCVGAAHGCSARGLAHSMTRFSFVGRNIQALEGHLLLGILLGPRSGYWYEEP